MQPPFPSLTPTWHNTTYPAISPTQPHLSQAGKTVLITGASRGIGARIAHAFAAAGASPIALTGRSASNLDAVKASIVAQYPNTHVLTFATDVTDEAKMSAAFAATKAASPDGRGIDICIANAGYFPDMTPLAASATAEWWAAFTTNVLGAYLTARLFLATLHRPTSTGDAAAEPVLVGLSTAAIAWFPPPQTMSAYATSKVAATRVFECVADENPHVRVVNVHPGAVETDMGNKAFDAGIDVPHDDVELGAHFVVWAVSADAAFTRSRMVWCNWDVDELKARAPRIANADPAFLNIGVTGWPYTSEV